MTAAVTPPLDSLRTAQVRPLLPPALLREELPARPNVATLVQQARSEVVDILEGRDDRLVVVVGPCSIHDPEAAREYAGRLAAHAGRVRDELRIVMRTYFEKPRSTLGWKGLINDPRLDGSFDVNTGLRHARRLLLDVGELGLPVGCEFLDPITPQYLADVVSWGSIGARTAASQVHRQLCSGLSMPVGIKNSPAGDVQVAVDGVRAAASSHVFMGVNPDGLATLITTTGNPHAHVVLRGGARGTNYDRTTVAETATRLHDTGMYERILIDASHGNSHKDHRRQPEVVRNVAERVATGEHGIAGLMLESFLIAGRQALGPSLVRGQSITDACIDWDTTADLLDYLAHAVRERRS